MANLDDIVITLDPIVLPIGETKTHESTSWILARNNRYDPVIYQSLRDVDNLTSIEIDRDLIGDNTDLFVKVIVHYSDGTEDPPIKISQNASQRGLTYSNNIITTPDVKVGIVDDIIGNIIIEPSTFSMYRGLGGHKATSYRICELSGKIVYERLYDIENKDYLSIYLRELENIVEINKTYLIKVKHHSDTNCASSWGMTSKTFGIDKILEHKGV